MSMSSLASGRSQAMHLHQPHRLTLRQPSLEATLPAPRLPNKGTQELAAPLCFSRKPVPGMTAALLGQTSQTLVLPDGQRDQIAADRLAPVYRCTWSPVALQGLARQHGVVAIRVELQAGHRSHLLLQATQLGSELLQQGIIVLACRRQLAVSRPVRLPGICARHTWQDMWHCNAMQAGGVYNAVAADRQHWHGCAT